MEVIDDLDLQTVYLARKEISARSLKVSFTHLPLLIALYFYHFDLKQNLVPFKIACLVCFLIHLVRTYHSWSLLKLNPHNISKSWNVYLFLSTLHVTMIGMLYSIAAWEIGLSDPHSFVLGLQLGAAAYLAVITTSFDKFLFIFTQMAFITPIIIATIVEFQRNGISSIFVVTIFMMLQMMVAIFKQVEILRKQIYDRIKNNLKFEWANQKLIEQTETIAHTARMSALGEMAAGISHEINNPLMIVSGNNELIEKMLEKSPSDLSSLQNRVQKSRVAINRISYIIKGLLTFSRQNQNIAKEVTSLETIINETFIFCFEMLKSHDVNIFIDTVPKISLSCRPLQISEVLFNLIKNADDQLQDLPKEDKWIKILFQEDAELIHIRVINGGPVIKKEYHEKIFQPFFTTRAIGSRVGLGLAISKGFIEDNYGELKFEKDAQQTTFVITLPKLNIK